MVVIPAIDENSVSLDLAGLRTQFRPMAVHRRNKSRKRMTVVRIMRLEVYACTAVFLASLIFHHHVLA
jgi:hypothetical protein